MRGSKLSMGVIKKQDFGITCKVVKYFLEIREEEWKVLKKWRERKREVYCLSEAVVNRVRGRIEGR